MPQAALILFYQLMRLSPNELNFHKKSERNCSNVVEGIVKT